MADPLTFQQQENQLYTGSTDLQDAQRYDMGTILGSIDMANLAAQQEKEMMTQRGSQASDWEEMVKGGEDGFKKVAAKRGFLSQYESAQPLIGGDSLRKKLIRDLVVGDLTGADEKQMTSGVPQLQVAKSVLGLTDATDEAFDRGLDGFIDKQIKFRETREALYKLSSKSALNGTSWTDMVAEATTLAGGDITPFKDVLNQGRSDVFRLLGTEDVRQVNNLWQMTKQISGGEAGEMKGDPMDTFAAYERMTRKQREGIMAGLAMKAEDEGEDVDGAFNRIGMALRSGEVWIVGGLVSNYRRRSSDMIGDILQSGKVPAKITEEITPKNVVEVSRRIASGIGMGDVENFGFANPEIKTRPLTDNEKLVLSETQKAVRGASRFAMDLQNAGIKSKEYRRQATKGGWFFGDSLENTVVNLAESVPSMVVTAIPVVGPVVMQQSYSESARARIEAQSPNMPEDQVALQANAEGAWKAGADIIQNKLFASKLPKLNAAVMKLGKPGGVALFAGRAVTTGVLETGQEVFQDISEPVIQSLASALNEDIKGPDWQSWLSKEYESLGDIFRVSMLMGIVGGAGSTISDYMDGSKLRETLMDKQSLALNGINPEAIENISKLAQTNPAAAAQLLQSEQISTSPETRMQNAQTEMRRQELETANTTLREAGLPELEQQEDGQVLVRYNDGITNDRLFPTPDEAKASMDAVFEGHQQEQARVNRELLGFLEGSYRKTAGDVSIEQRDVMSASLEEAVALGETTPEIARQRARIYLRNAKDQMGITDLSDDGQIDSVLGRLVIQGASRNEYAGEVTKMVLQIKNGAKPTVVFEEAIEAFGKWMIDKGGVSPDRMYGWIKQTEAKVGEVLIAENFRDLSPDLMFQELIEAWSRIGVAHATGRIADSQLSQQIKDFFKAIRQLISDVLRLSVKVREFTDSSDIDPEFRMWLDRAAGLDVEGEIATQQQLADAEILSQIGESFSISQADDDAYLSAVESGDMAAAQRMVDQAAKSAGYSVHPVTHITPAEFESFDRSFFRSGDVEGFYFAGKDGGSNWSLYTGGDRTINAYLKLENPVHMDVSRLKGTPEENREYLQEQGYDGVIDDTYRGNQYIVFDPNQIKSADPVTYDVQGNVIPLSQRFNPEDNRITFAVASAADPISSALDSIRSNPEAFAKFANAAKVAVADVNRRASLRALNSNLRQRDFDQFRDIAKLEAIARALPGELRGILTSAFRKVAEMRTTEGRERYIASLLPKVEQAIENNLQKTLRKEIKKTLKKGAVKVSDARTRGGKIGGVAHAIFEEAQRAIKITDTPELSALQQADQLADKLRDQMEGNVTDEQLEELDGRVAAIELFADYENADSSRLTDALDLLKGVYAQGRAERLAVLKARKEQRQQRVQTILKGLDREGPITDAQRNAAKRKFSKFWSRINEGIIQAGASGGQKFRRISENTDDAATKAVVEDLEFAALEAELAEQDANESDNVALGQAMRSIFGAKTEYGVSSKLRELTTPEVAPVEKAEGKTSDQTIKVPMKYAEAIAFGQTTGFQTKSGKSVELTPSQIEQVRDQLEEMDPEDQAGVRSIEVTEEGQSGERTTIGEISQLEGLQLWLTMRQPDQFAKLEKMGYDQQTMDQLEAWLKPETKALGLWMVNRIGEEAFTIDQLHRSEKGVGLRLVENYFPVRNDVSGSDNTGLSIDGPVQHTGKSISSLKERVKNNAPPAYVNAVAVFLANRAQTNFWKSHVSFLREWGGVLRDERVAAGIKNRMGETYYRSLMTTMKRIEGGGALNAAGLMDWEKVVRKMTSNFALATLGGRLSTLLINTTAGLNSLLEIPAGQLAAGLGDLAQRPEAFKDAFNSPAMQRRFKTGGTYEAQLARAPGRSLNPVVAQLSAAAQVPVSLITKVDTGSQVIGAAIAWEYTRKQSLASGMDEQAARAEADKKVERIFLRAAQPTTRLAKSELELKAAENPLAALFTLFTSEPRKNLAIGYLAARELITGKGNYGRAMAAQQLFTVMLVQTTAAYLIRSAYASLAGAKDEEDEEFTERFSKRMDPKAMTYSLLTEHLKAVPIAGEIYNKAMAGMFDQPSFDSSQNPLNRVTQKGWKFAEKMFTDDKPATREETIDGGIDLAQSLGTILPGGQIFAQSANLAEAVEGIISSNFQETLSDEDRIRRIKARFSKFSKEYTEEKGKVSDADGKIDKEKQKARNAVLADQLKIELLPLTPELRDKALEELNVSDAVKKQAGFEVER